ncbi:helix-turn-helix transcriptional regulator [Pedobacter sp. Hv1]|uniref:helix-turn-helix transcriptional regulator n=1 Tax=Pedobacter sp. Hv1 TaxID=1740090 RepID=UPI0006D8B8DF|nr:response regulator transcription factor [Pedobacter sp. Hv1]KQC01354.1 hypothetical protein AQF98_06480 [Pedobacter sp. Hv1]
MNFSKQILFFLSALGAFNGVILSVYLLLFKKEKSISNIFLGGLLAALSIRIGKSIFFYFNPQLSKTYLQIGLSACFLIGPLLFFYVKSKQQRLNITVAKYSIAVLVLFLIVLGWLFPYHTYTFWWANPIYYIINAQWLCFILIAIYSARDIFAKLGTRAKQMSYDEVWILTVICGVFVIWTSYNTAKYTSYISGALSFSFIFYLSFMVVFYESNNTFNFSMLKRGRYLNKIEESVAHNILVKITAVFDEQQIYKNPDLTLTLLAKELNVRPQFLSQLLNDNLNKSFNQFINEYRVEEAKRLLKEATHLKIDTIGTACGFNSSSTFYNTFKKITGFTPSNYVKA